MDALADSFLFINLIWALGTSIYFFGGAFGALIAGSTIDKYDRKKVVFVNSGMIVIPFAIMVVAFFSGVTLLFIIARFLLGIISGIFSCAVPIYLAEISPTGLRGAVCSWYTVMYAFGVIAAIACGHPDTLGDDPWIIMMMLPIAPIVVQMILMRWCPISPRFLLIKQSKYDAALKVLKWLRHTEVMDPLEKELEEISTELEDYFLYRAVRYVQWNQLFKMRYMRKPMLISIMIMCAQQLCGINVFLLYSSAIFEEAGLPGFYGDLSTVILGIVFFVTSIISMFLIEIAGRRMLMLYGYVGSFIFSVGHYLTYLYNSTRHECIGAVTALFMWFYIIHYALGPSSIPWFIVSEMFNQSSRPKAMAVAACCNWFLNSLVAITFWPINTNIQAHVFLIYLFCQMVLFILLLKYLPETMNKSITEVTKLYM
ncbi:hypothetical protein HHI36_003996 [Cryptolaemus montrouzieri]